MCKKYLPGGRKDSTRAGRLFTLHAGSIPGTAYCPLHITYSAGAMPKHKALLCVAKKQGGGEKKEKKRNILQLNLPFLFLQASAELLAPTV